METFLAVSAIIIILGAIYYMDRVQHGTTSSRCGKTPENTGDLDGMVGRCLVSKGTATVLTLILPGSGHLLRGRLSHGVRYVMVAVYCWLAIAIAIYNEIPGMKNLFLGILVIDVIHALYMLMKKEHQGGFS